MKFITSGTVICICILFTINTQAQVTDTITAPIYDAEIRQQFPNNNYSSGNELTLRPRATSSENIRSLVKFGLDSIPEDIEVSNAKLRIYTTGCTHCGTSKMLAAHRVLQHWDPSTVTWNSTGYGPWTTPGATINTSPAQVSASTAGTWIEFDVTADLQLFVSDSAQNYGWLLKIHSEDQSGHAWTYAASEYLSGQFAPQLIIQYNFLLPVELGEISAKAVGNTAAITWSTLKEEDNDHFEVQHSSNGRNWNTIGIVDGNGTTGSRNEYNFIDDSPEEGVNYYRLKQVDHNGYHAILPVVSVYIDKTVPTDMIGNVSISGMGLSVDMEIPSPGSYQVAIYDMSGRMVVMQKRYFNEGNENMSLPLDGCSSGIYILSIGNDSLMESKKLFIP